MELEKVVDTEKINPIALKYADAILAGMPPKQAEIQRMAVTKMCELLFIEGALHGKAETFKDFNGILNGSRNESSLVLGLVHAKFRAEFGNCVPSPFEENIPSQEIQYLPLSTPAMQLLEVFYQYIQHLSYARLSDGNQEKPNPGAAG